MTLDWSWFGGFAILLLSVVFLLNAVRIFREYERGVVFTLGRFWKVKGPGLVIIIPGIQQVVRVDLRTVVLEVPTQDVISRDNVSVKVSAVVYPRVIDAQKAVMPRPFAITSAAGAKSMCQGFTGRTSARAY